MAGMIGDEDIARVREASDLVALMGERSPVRQRGRDFWCCCPFHSEKTPSCKIDPALQLWHCFGCGEGGDVFAYVMKMEDLSFPEAVRWLAERAHIDLPESGGGSHVGSGRKARLKAVCAEAADFWHVTLMRGKDAGAAAARDYLGGRGLGGAIPKEWRLGFAPGRGTLVRMLSAKGFSPEEMLQANVAVKGGDGRLRDRFFNRIMFPIADEAGDVIAFGGRVVGQGEPKYLNSQETPLFHKSSVLYGMDKAKAAMAASGTAIVVEGYTDVIALHASGVKNVVATLGTALTMRHVRLLSRHASKRIVYLFDGDAAGQRAADRALQFIDASMTPEAGRTRVELFAVTLPDDLDPADFVAQRGAGELARLVDAAQPLLAYGIERRLAAHDLSRAEGRSAALVDALAVLAPIKDSVIAHDYALQVAARTRTREDVALAALARTRAPRVAEADDGGAGYAGEGRTGRLDEAAGAGAFGQGRPAGGAAGPRGDANAARGGAGAAGEQERNRLQVERELLGVLAHHPDLALAHADALAQAQWHDAACASVAAAMLDALAEDPAADAATLVAAAARANPAAAGILTAQGEHADGDAAGLARYLAEELSIGDEEDALEQLKAQLASPQAQAAGEDELLFQSVAAMQRELMARKASHRLHA